VSAVAVYLSGLALAMGVVSFALRYLRNPLEVILTDLCGTADRARFWLSFSNVILFLVPFALALDHRSQAFSWQTTVFDLGGQIETATIGFGVSVLVVGFMISRYIPRTGPMQPAKGSDSN
jgi:hypothetical protein